MNTLKYGLAYKTELPASEIEDWLDNNCSGDWDVSLADIDESDPLHVKKKLELFFEKAEDKERFKTQFSKRPAHT